MEWVGWKFFLAPDITNPLKMFSFFAFFSGDDCRDQEEMCKIRNVSSLCWGCMFCYRQLELRADERALPLSHKQSRIAQGNQQR